MPRKTRKRVKPKTRGNSIKFKHRLIRGLRGGSISKRTIPKTRGTISKVSPSHMPTSAIGWSRRSAQEREENQEVLNFRPSTTRASSVMMQRSRGVNNTRQEWLKKLQDPHSKVSLTKTSTKPSTKTSTKPSTKTRKKL